MRAMRREEFEKLALQALKELPKEFKRRMENVAIVVEEYPSRKLLHELGLKPPDTLFGLYQGVPLDARGSSYGGVLPDKITLYQRPLVEASNSLEDLTRNIKSTIIHEVGHHFGLDEEELERLELNQRRSQKNEGASQKARRGQHLPK